MNMKMIIDGSKFDSRESLHEYISDKLEFPDWYGNNLDALYDCLSDVNEETEIEMIHRDEFHSTFGKYARAFERVLRDVCSEKENIKFKVKE